MPDAKGGGLEFLIAFVGAFFVAGILIVSLLITINSISGTQGAISSPEQHLNERFNLTSTGYSTAVASQLNVQLNNLLVINASGGETVSTGNYTVSAGIITGVASANYLSEFVNASYNATWLLLNTTTGNALTNLSNGLVTLTNNFGTFVAVAVVVVIIALVAVLIGYLAVFRPGSKGGI